MNKYKQENYTFNVIVLNLISKIRLTEVFMCFFHVIHRSSIWQMRNICVAVDLALLNFLKVVYVIGFLTKGLSKRVHLFYFRFPIWIKGLFIRRRHHLIRHRPLAALAIVILVLFVELSENRCSIRNATNANFSQMLLSSIGILRKRLFISVVFKCYE